MKRRRVIMNIIAVVSALVYVLPLLWTLETSLRPISDIYQYPPTVIAGRLTLANYQYIFTEMHGFTRYVLNSIIVTFLTVAIVVTSSAMSGYAFGARKFRGQNLLFGSILFFLALPYIVYLIPIYIMEDKIGLLNSWLGLILPYVALNLPWGLLIMRGAFSTIPLDVRDAAVIDGCNEFQLWYRVMLPLTRPAIAATAIITFVFAWQEFLFVSTLMSRNEWQTLPVGIVWLRDELQTVVYGRVSAMIVVSIVPIIILFIVFRKFFIEGLTEGMLKG